MNASDKVRVIFTKGYGSDQRERVGSVLVERLLPEVREIDRLVSNERLFLRRGWTLGTFESVAKLGFDLVVSLDYRRKGRAVARSVRCAKCGAEYRTNSHLWQFRHALKHELPKLNDNGY